MKHTNGWAAIAAATLGLATGQASASVCDVYGVDGYTALEGATVCFRYKESLVSPLYGLLQVSGDNIFATPTEFKAEAFNSGIDTTNGVGTVEIIAKAGYRLDAVAVGESGTYSLLGADSFVSVSATLRVFDYNNPTPGVGIEEHTSLAVTSVGDFNIRDAQLHGWSANGGFDLTTSLWTDVNHVGLTLTNYLVAMAANPGLAMIQKTGTGTEIEVSVITSSEVPVPAALWLLGSGLLGLVGVARRRRA